jgi:hypothetical protein
MHAGMAAGGRARCAVTDRDEMVAAVMSLDILTHSAVAAGLPWRDEMTGAAVAAATSDRISRRGLRFIETRIVAYRICPTSAASTKLKSMG